MKKFPYSIVFLCVVYMLFKHNNTTVDDFFAMPHFMPCLVITIFGQGELLSRHCYTKSNYTFVGG